LAAHRVYFLAGRHASRHSMLRAEHGCGPTVQILSQRTSGLKIRLIWTQWTIVCGVQCWTLTESWKQSRTQSPKSRKHFRLSGATCHKDRSTRLWKTYQIKWLKACVGAWSWRWPLRTFTVTMEFRHLVI